MGGCVRLAEASTAINLVSAAAREGVECFGYTFRPNVAGCSSGRGKALPEKGGRSRFLAEFYFCVSTNARCRLRHNPFHSGWLLMTIKFTCYIVIQDEATTNKNKYS